MTPNEIEGTNKNANTNPLKGLNVSTSTLNPLQGFLFLILLYPPMGLGVINIEPLCGYKMLLSKRNA